VPRGDLAIDSASGDIYGVADSGVTGDGVIFKVVKKHETVLHNFCKQANCPDGAEPQGVMLDSGVLYGTTFGGGGANDRGVVFKMPIGGGPESTLYTFCSSKKDCADGRPNGALASDGLNLFGAAQGGRSDGGAVFELSGSGTQSVIHNFCGPICVAGSNPSGGVIIFGNNLFGAAQTGGTIGMGSIYENAIR
jgi:uncharacterized repeat protein (TIGR03803 family)